MCDIQKLVNLLRENVDAISSGRSLLVLTVPVLQKMNESFVLINEQAPNPKDAAVQVPADAIVEQRLLDDLTFLLRLVRRTPGLRLVSSGACHPGEEPRSPAVSVEHFHSLRHLVLHKVRLCDVRGLSTLAPRLTSLCCDGDPQQLLAAAGTWPELRTATFCRAGVSAVPVPLAAAAPELAVLDLGHNRLSDTAGADFSAFRSLSRLGLAYNAFEAVPSGLPPGLTALGLACNYVDTIDGVSRLASLVELDLSGNCLAAHGCLAPLSGLPALRRLDLRANPLAFHPRHRVLAAAVLHSAALTCEFVLDGQHLSQSERAVGLSGRREGRCGGRTSSESAEREPPSPVPAERLPPPPEDSLSTGSSTASDKTLVADGTTPGRRQSTAGGGDGSRTAPVRKSRHVRKAVISDLEAADPTDDGSLIGSVTSIRSSPPDLNAEHLETKRRVESLRQMFGHDNWLHSQGGTFLQDVLGLPPTAATASALLGGTAPDSEPAAAPASPGVVDSAVAEVDSVEVLKEGNSDTLGDSCEHTLPSEEGNGQREEEEIIPPADDEEEADESEQQLYAVRRLLSAVGKQQQQTQQQELFLAVTDRQLKERDTATGRLLCRWQSEALQSCELLSAEPARIRVTFDTVKPDRRERTYFVEDAKDAQHLLQTLRAILDERPLQANNLSVFRCMKCSSQFSEEVESPLVPDPRLDGTLRCPNCGSAVVVQAEEELQPQPQPEQQPLLRPTGGAVAEPPSRRRADIRTAVAATAPAPEDPPVADSPSQSSIGSAASLDALGEPSASATPSGTGSGGPRRCESDIEIISNPSQSSIEVLDGSGARTPGRKRSSEERQVAAHGFPAVTGPQVAAPPLLPTLPPPMTESSSSDSLTDSVCTAYEGRAPASAPAPAAALTAPLQTGPGPQVAEPAASPPGAPRRAAPRPDATPRPGVPLSDVPQYSYVDFGWADHRIKLHLYVSVFQQRDEELTTLVKGHVLCKNLTQPKPALVVLSTHKVYLLYITRQESDEPRRWLVPADAWPLRQLREVRALPWGQGVSLLLSPTGSTPAAAATALLLLLYDAEHTSALLTHLAGPSLGDGCCVEREPLQQHTDAVRRLAATPDRPDDDVRVAGFFVAASVITDSGTVSMGSGTLVIGESVLSLSTDSLLWLLPSSGKPPELWAAQSISNLVEVEVDGETVTPVFLDESSGTAREIRWVLRMGSAAVVSALLDAVRPPWEQLFSLPLQVSLSGQSR
ncbi:serine/threonine-protein kinase 11-interacting protein [Schistocerca serialis cubense]|uniref:serine/threonine-protein kinase 11-interacting protein n=1 Tax=Schistocerca serialis cubense TaxID=2023355 RepID=UPI00214ECF43|nr:serine/threonine-protein kinase 11-interacting protein [Schistocerca serialis cubense]